MNKSKVKAKMDKFKGGKEGIEFLLQSGFDDKGELLIMDKDDANISRIQATLAMLNKEMTKEEARLQIERNRIVQQNKERLQNSPGKQKELMKKRQSWPSTRPRWRTPKGASSTSKLQLAI